MTFAQLRFIIKQLMQQHRSSILLCVLSMSFAAALLMSVIGVQAQAQAAFSNNDMGFNAVIGPRGSRLQLVLNSIFHIDQATGTMPWSRYQDIKNDKRVLEAYPITVGDNYMGFHMVGCVPEMFTEHEFEEGKKVGLTEGRLFDPYLAEAVIGSFVAEQLEMKVGDTFFSYHGLQFDESQKHDLEFTVVGIFEPTNTPLDRALWTPLESYYRMPGHSLYGSGKEYIPQQGVSIPDIHKEASAVLCNVRTSSGLQLNAEINRHSKDLTFAWPVSTIILELFQNLAWVDALLALIAVLVFIIATLFIGSTLYQSMQQQQRDFVLIRALGAKRKHLSFIILGEAFIIALRGLLISFPMYSLILGFAATFLRATTGVYLTLWYWHPILLVAPIMVLIMTLIAALIPAMRVYTSDVAEQLQQGDA